MLLWKFYTQHASDPTFSNNCVNKITNHKPIVFDDIALDDFPIIFKQRLNILDGRFFWNFSDENFERII